MHFAFPPEGFAADVLTDRSPSSFPAQAMSNYFLNNKQAAAKTTSPHPCGCPQGGERRAERRQQCSQGCSFRSRLPRAAPCTPGIVPACRERILPERPRPAQHSSCAFTPRVLSHLAVQCTNTASFCLSLPSCTHSSSAASLPAEGPGQSLRAARGSLAVPAAVLVGHGCTPASGPAGGHGAGTMEKMEILCSELKRGEGTVWHRGNSRAVRVHCNRRACLP